MNELVAPPACANCGAALQGPFCHACGQEAKPIDPSLREFVRDTGQELLDVDGRVWRSLRYLLTRPGYLTREYVEGRRVPWLTPLKLYLLTSVFFFAVSAFVGSGDVVQVQIGGDEAKVDRSLRAIGYEDRAAFERALQQGRELRDVWMPRFMFALVPFFAALVALVRRGSGRGFPAHVQFALHVHAAFFAVRGVVAATGLVLPPAAVDWLQALANLYTVGYLFVAMRRVYGGSRWRVARDLVLIGVPYWLALMLAIAGLVLWMVFGHALTAWLAAWWMG